MKLTGKKVKIGWDDNYPEITFSYFVLDLQEGLICLQNLDSEGDIFWSSVSGIAELRIIEDQESFPKDES